MKFKDFKLYLKENEESISEIDYILPDDSEVSSKGIRIPDSVESQPFFSATVILHGGTDSEAESIVLVQNPRALSTDEPSPVPPKPQKIESSDSLELAQSRQFYTAMMEMTNKSFEQVFFFFSEAQKSTIEAIRENEKTLDRRLKTFIRDAREGMEEDFDTPPTVTQPETQNESLKLVTDAVAGIFKRIQEGGKKDE